GAKSVLVPLSTMGRRRALALGKERSPKTARRRGAKERARGIAPALAWPCAVQPENRGHLPLLPRRPDRARSAWKHSRRTDPATVVERELHRVALAVRARSTARLRPRADRRSRAPRAPARQQAAASQHLFLPGAPVL